MKPIRYFMKLVPIMTLDNQIIGHEYESLMSVEVNGVLIQLRRKETQSKMDSMGTETILKFKEYHQAEMEREFGDGLVKELFGSTRHDNLELERVK